MVQDILAIHWYTTNYPKTSWFKTTILFCSQFLCLNSGRIQLGGLWLIYLVSAGARGPNPKMASSLVTLTLGVLGLSVSFSSYHLLHLDLGSSQHSSLRVVRLLQGCYGSKKVFPKAWPEVSRLLMTWLWKTQTSLPLHSVGKAGHKIQPIIKGIGIKLHMSMGKITMNVANFNLPQGTTNKEAWVNDNVQEQKPSSEWEAENEYRKLWRSG